VSLTNPHRLYSRSEILSRESPVPREPGVYAWYFRSVPSGVPTDGCTHLMGYTLLYVGISPKATPKNGRKPSTQTLWHRLRYHMRGNAEGSTLRLSLGCLLGRELGIELRRVGSGTRLTFGNGEERLSQWIEQNALVSWEVDVTPWKAEKELITRLCLPLNLEGNLHPFCRVLSGIRAEARVRARALPAVQ